MYEPIPTATAALRQIRSGETSLERLVQQLRQNFEASNHSVRAFLEIDWPGSAADANGRLAGLPVAVKDNICVANTRTSAGSKILEQFISPYDATVVERLKKSGAVVLGKTNLDEFGMGSATIHSAFHQTTNPWDHSRVPGGSSGGSAAAVASGTAVWSLGSDTGGSIRQPAAFCGLTGLKPTFGRVSRYGLIAFASSLEQIGPICHSAQDAALLLQHIAGHDPKDATSIDRSVPDYVESLGSPAKRLRIGVLGEQLAAVSGDMATAIENSISDLEGQGHSVHAISLDSANQWVAAYYVIACCEASSNLARYDGIRYTRRAPAENLDLTYRRTRSEFLGDEVKRRILLGTYALSAGYAEKYYFAASAVRERVRAELEDAFDRVDILLGPTTPTTAYTFAEAERSPAETYQADQFTVLANLTGIPAISIPCGLDRNGLPVGMQLMAPHFKKNDCWDLRTSSNWPRTGISGGLNDSRS